MPSPLRGDFREELHAELTAVRDRLLSRHDLWLQGEKDGVLDEPGTSLWANACSKDWAPTGNAEVPAAVSRVRTQDDCDSEKSQMSQVEKKASLAVRMQRMAEETGHLSENQASKVIIQGIVEEVHARLSLAQLGLVQTTSGGGLCGRSQTRRHSTMRASAQTLLRVPGQAIEAPSKVFELHSEWTSSEWTSINSGEFESEADKMDVQRHLTHLSKYHPDPGDSGDVLMPRCMINPNSNRRLVWEAIGIFLLMYDIVLVPTIMAFSIRQTWYFHTMDIMTLTYWLMDLVTNFRLAFYQGGATLITSATAIARRYMWTWLCFDVAILAIDGISILATEHNSEVLRIGSLMRSLRVLRFLRLLRVAKLKNMIHEIRMRIDSQYVYLVLNITQLIVLLIVANHIIACAWYWIGSEVREDAKTWVDQQDFRNEDLGYIYMTALHWSLTQFTPASMTVQPHNANERAFAIVVLVLALITFGSFLSSITSAITSLRKLDARHEGQFWLLRKYLRQHKISRDLAMRVTRYLQVAVSRQKTRVQEGQIELMALLSHSLRARLQKELFTQNCNHPFFEVLARRSAVTMSDMCVKAVSQEQFSKGDVLFHELDPARSMFLLNEGTTVYFRPNMPPQHMRVGSWCSEAALWVKWVHRGDMFATVECCLFTIDSERFRKTMMLRRADAAFIRRYARQFLTLLQAAEADGDVSDLRPVAAELEATGVISRSSSGSISQLDT